MDFKWKGDYFETDLEFGTLRISGNEEHGFRPYQLMVSSIAVCSTSVLRQILEKQRMTIEDIEAHADVTRDEEQANRISAIALHYKIKGQGLSEKKLDKAVVLAAKNCAMAQTVKGAVDLTETYEIIPE
ncbi:OsmC family protein [Alkalicoccus saliphilus]|uniref:Osmotically inducible protein C n=1 Tax=Alkalicoccus saliphilus TaxID=200989 RepID=A0A2T4U7I9_9BACI|nr:OsmC family protein [Alkalicoccus saliphilus]PTL39332.1 osmotically inducible protein C [Alkalicoccus saliphilus]